MPLESVIELILHVADPQLETYWFGSRIGEQLMILVIGAALGVGGQLVVDYFRRDDVGEYELWTDIHSASQKAEGIGRLKTGLSIHAGDREVANPYVVDFYVWGVGKKDIRPESFDGKPLEFKLNVPIVAELDGSTEGNIESARFSWSPDGVVTLAPSLVRSRIAKRYRFLTDGKPDLKWTNMVADLKVYEFDEQWGKPTPDRLVAKWAARIMAGLSAVGFLVVIIVSMVRGIIEGPKPRPTSEITDPLVIPDSFFLEFGWIVLLVMGWFALMLFFFGYGAAPSRRPKRANRLRMENLAPTSAPVLKTERDYMREQLE
ncbi:hypothetical protein [Microbacterium sp. cf046]|uniref:hypothetical protein n=1 Tax=Microbacterium sp. cf046 TaxID=1761803 RepID=UPI000B82EEF0|nr:hypothetical protein [Microbacterium sp. cf046]